MWGTRAPSSPDLIRAEHKIRSCLVEPDSGSHATTLSDTARSQEWAPDLVRLRFSSLVCRGCPPSYTSSSLLEFFFLSPSPLLSLPVLDPSFSFWPSPSPRILSSSSSSASVLRKRPHFPCGSLSSSSSSLVCLLCLPILPPAPSHSLISPIFHS